MRMTDIQFRIQCKAAEIAEETWRRDHYLNRRAELTKRKAPAEIIRRYDMDLVDVIHRLDLLNLELGDLKDLQLEPV